ncbi:hypothetical protein [Microbacterium sp. MPKO10]|uniref:hypothetical protein n=1 Tax=Microbacterium sp. MPKO10 TaxID=2989818 RepID=UPI00223552C5|nr:hypothetical protein [Microbacterium sp. MPKO10]MCW4460054.1 hypothetical protein [Microbacterium sp. MPKO10]
MARARCGLALLGVVLYALPLLMAGPEDRADAQFSAVIGLALIVLGLVVLALYFRTRVVIDEHGFRLESSWFHVPLKRIACGSIRSVETAFIRPGEWGG